MDRQLMIPVITWGGVPLEHTLLELQKRNKNLDWTVSLWGIPWEETHWVLRGGVSGSFYGASGALLERFRGYAQSILVLGTTGEGIDKGPLQSKVILRAMKAVCPADIVPYAGILGLDVNLQMRTAQELWYKDLVLGIHHVGHARERIQQALASLDSWSRLLLYSLPTFPIEDQEKIINLLLQEERIAGYKTWNSDFLRVLIERVKSQRPDFNIFHGSEEGFSQADDEMLENLNGLVGGTGNVNPQLLSRFVKNPRSQVTQAGLRALQKKIQERSMRRSDTWEVSNIWRFTHGMKLFLKDIWILDSQAASMYSNPRDLFKPFVPVKNWHNE